MEYIIAFGNTNFAIKAEQCLLERELNVRVMPLPPQIRAGCGICLRLNHGEIGAALEILSESNIDDIALYIQERENGKNKYTEVRS